MVRSHEVLAGLPDRRTRKGRRYSLAAILTLALAAMLAGANDLLAIHRWGRRLSAKGLAAVGIAHGRAPAHATLHYVFRALPAADLARALRGLVPVAGGLGHVAIDGKRLRGSQKEASPGVHLLTAFATRLQATVAALVVPPDSAEMVAALALIRELPLGPGDVVAGDAAFTYRPAVEAIQATGAAYFLLVKANQPELQAELAHAFGDDVPVRVAAAAGTEDRRRDPPDLARAETVDKEHGRIETRRIAVRRPPARLAEVWPGVARVCRIERLRETATYCTRQIVYAITSLPPETAPAGDLLHLARAHWQIENRLFRVRDGTFQEDACRVRSAEAPAALAHLRDACLALIRRTGQAPKAAREAFAANPKAAIKAACNGMD